MNPVLSRLETVLRDFEFNVTKMKGNDLILLSTLLTYFSARKINWKGKEIRGWLETLILGDTRVGKTSTAQRIRDYIELGQMTTGECTSLAGLLGGVMQIYGKHAIRWGAFAYSNGTLVIIDEANRLDPDSLYNLNTMRSSGTAQVTKIVSGMVPAETRKIWIANPREGGMSDYANPVESVMDFCGHPEVMARFDLIVTPARHAADWSKLQYVDAFASKSQYRDLVNFIWTRTTDQVAIDPDAEELCETLARKQTQDYITDVPMVLEHEQAERLIRVAAALAGLTPLAEDYLDKQIVRIKVRDVEAADQVMRQFLDADSLGYGKYAKDYWMWKNEFDKRAPGLAEWIRKKLPNYEPVLKILKTGTTFRTIHEMLEGLSGGQEISAAKEVLNLLVKWRLIDKQPHAWRMTPSLRTFISNHFNQNCTFELPDLELKESEVV